MPPGLGSGPPAGLHGGGDPAPQGPWPAGHRCPLAGGTPPSDRAPLRRAFLPSGGTTVPRPQEPARSGDLQPAAGGGRSPGPRALPPHRRGGSRLRRTGGPLFTGSGTLHPGRGGPGPLLQAHPALAELLRTSRPGQLQAPLRIEQWWLVVRLESLRSAGFDHEMRDRMARELFDEWVEEEMRILLAVHTTA